ncbi:carnosine synthase 1 [Alligator sinensis]|uniref:Carnosine synthase 1 n=1 Tax=Alligator sinensis TaxID=38654 RepID=A0A1U7SAN5_ALLSI|nr:carnosine synthase 1 [Alligator sinensis]XP_014380420.1 carnosine synthase 1 [Alligator sinensis]
MLSLDQINVDQPLILKELDWAEQGPLPSIGSLRPHWRQDVSLDCKISPEDSHARACTAYYYDLLQGTLQQEGLPETIDRTKEPRTGFSSTEVTICILGSPTSYLSVLLEGGSQCPGSMLLCLSPCWLSKVPSLLRPGESSLLVSKAISFEQGGRTFLEEFSPPRRVTYFTGSFGPCKEHEQSAGELARDLDCPTGGSGELARLLEDKLLTRQLLDARAQVGVPPTLAFTFQRPQLLQGLAAQRSLHVVELSGKEGQENLVQEEVGAFLQGGAMEPYSQVVVKPSGWRWSGAHTVSFHVKVEQAAVLQAVLALLETLEEEESALVEAFIPTARFTQFSSPDNSSLCSTSPRPNLAIRICTVVCRSWADQPLLTKVVCGMGRADKPLKHQATVPQTLESSLQEWGMTDEAQITAIRAQIKQKAEAAMRAFMEMEAELSVEQRGGRRTQTDVIGVDFLLTSSEEVLQLVALEMNSQLCLETCALFESMGQAVGVPRGSSQPLVETMLRRAQCHLMEGKHVLVIGAGGVSKKFVWEAAREYGLKIHLVESDPNHFASQLVQTFIHYDSTDHKRDEEHAQRVVELVQERGLHLDGCLSYWDDCMVLTALVCEQLGLRCSPTAAMRVAKQKSRTHQHLLRRRKDAPRGWPSTAVYAVPCWHLESQADVERAAHHLSFPGVMKLEYGAGAVGVKLVEDAQQCHLHFEKISQDLREDTDHPGIGLGWGNAMLLMEYVSGTEHDVDLVIFEGRMLAAFVSDNGPTRVPCFTETAASMPTCLPSDREAQLVRAAYQCCLGCGLTDGVFNVELKLTAAGPKLIEINPRMGGFYLRDWIREVFGVDIMLAAVMVACGVAPLLPTWPQPRTHLVGVMCVVSQHMQALKSTASLETLQALHEGGVVRLNLLDDKLISREYEEPYCNVACGGPSRHEACLKVLSICQALGIDSPQYPVAHFLSHFK